MDLWEVRMRMAEERAKELGLDCGTSLVQKYGPGGPWVYEYDDE
jgi:hypothetical protein